MRLKHWFYTVPLRLRSLFRRSQVERELDCAGTRVSPSSPFSRWRWESARTRRFSA